MPGGGCNPNYTPSGVRGYNKTCQVYKYAVLLGMGNGKTSQCGFARCDAKPMPSKYQPDANQMPTRCQLDANQMPTRCQPDATQDANKMPHRGYVVHTCMPDGILGYSSPSEFCPLLGSCPQVLLRWGHSAVVLYHHHH